MVCRGHRGRRGGPGGSGKSIGDANWWYDGCGGVRGADDCGCCCRGVVVVPWARSARQGAGRKFPWVGFGCHYSGGDSSVLFVLGFPLFLLEKPFWLGSLFLLAWMFGFCLTGRPTNRYK